MTTQELQQVLRLLANAGLTVRGVRRLPSGETELVIVLPK